MAPFSTQPAQEPALQQLGVEPVGFRSAMLARYRDTRGVDHMSLDATRRKPAGQPEAVAAGFEGKRNPRDRAAGPDRLPATSQLDWLSSTTAMIVLFWSRATRDLLRSFSWGIAALHRLHAATKLPSPCTSGGRLVGLS
jgi:hypothetical protein